MIRPKRWILLGSVGWLGLSWGGLAHAGPGRPARSQSGNSPAPLKVYPAVYLKVPFVVRGGQLVICREPSEGLGGPQGLYLLGPSRTLPIRSLAQLKGRVWIRSLKEALAFVRLKTSPGTRSLLTKPRYLEVMRKGDLDLPYVYGEARMLFALKRYAPEVPDFADGFEGVIREETARKLGFGPARSERWRGGYRVKRILVRPSAFRQRHEYRALVRVREWVGSKGEYRVLERKVLPTPRAPRVWWRIYDLGDY